MLTRQDRLASVLHLLQVMARTPAGSWPGSENFGLRDLLEGRNRRGEIPRIAMDRINYCFEDLGLGEFAVTEFIREDMQQSGLDSYSVTIALVGTEATVTTTVSRED